jgi:asparagine N-glycosylation enzyme membrane subunit Stt3
MIQIFSLVAWFLGIICFLLFTISPLLKKSRSFIKEGLGKTENYLVEIIDDIEKGESRFVISLKYILHIILSVVMSAFIAIIWPAIFVGFIVTVVSYIRQKKRSV